MRIYSSSFPPVLSISLPSNVPSLSCPQFQFLEINGSMQYYWLLSRSLWALLWAPGINWNLSSIGHWNHGYQGYKNISVSWKEGCKFFRIPTKSVKDFFLFPKRHERRSAINLGTADVINISEHLCFWHSKYYVP